MKIVLLEPEEPDQEIVRKIRRIHHLLARDQHEIIRHADGHSLYECVVDHHPDVVFNLASIYGANRSSLIPALLEIAGVRYTGSGVLGLTLVHNYTKLYPLLAASGIRVPPYQIIINGDAVDIDSLHPPLILRIDGMQEGQMFVDEDEIKNALRALPAGADALLQEIRSGRKESLFMLDSVPFLSILEDECIQMAKQAYQLLEARGLARFGFIHSGEWYLTSIDTCPDPLDKSLLQNAAENGWTESQLLHTLVDHAGSDLQPSPDGVKVPQRV